MLGNLLSGPIWTWLSRRLLEGLGTALATWGVIASDEQTTFIGAVSYLIGIAWNAFSTFRPQVVADGKQVPLKELAPSTQTTVKAAVERKPTLIEKIMGGASKK